MGVIKLEKINIERLNKTVVIDTLDNGLTVLFCKTKDYISKVAYFTTKYGSKDFEFIPISENKMKKFPQGIAHFLEHKVFEQKTGEIIFEKFSKRQADANAFTSQEQTKYHFSCSQNFYDNLEILLDFVQDPYFTDSNVEKEKGIISQELEMYKDNPNWVGYQKTYECLFVNSGYKYDIGGSVEEIMKITKEDLYKCYNTFYNPSNMYLVITGDLDEKEVFEFVRKNQMKKKFGKQDKIIKKEDNEPKEVAIKKLVLNENVVAQRSYLVYKIYLKNKMDEQTFINKMYLDIYLGASFGELTTVREDMINNKIVKSMFSFGIEEAGDFIIIEFDGNTINHNKFVNKIDKIINNKKSKEEDFNIFRKYIISNMISRNEMPSALNIRISELYYNYNKIFGNIIELCEKLNYKDYLTFIKTLDFSNKSEIIMKPKKK